MSTPVVYEMRFSQWAAVFTRAAATSAIIVGAAGVAGWWLNISVIRSVYPGLIPTTANSSFALVLAGIALHLRTGSKASSLDRRIGTVVCVVIMLIFAFGSVLEHVTDYDFGIDQMLFPRPAGESYPVRMAPTSAVNLTLVGCAILMLLWRRVIPIAQWIGLMSSIIGVLGMTGYVFLAPSLYSHGTYTAMSAQMAVLTTALGLAVLTAHPERGLMSVLLEPTAGGIVARRLLPFAVTFPALLIVLAYIERFAGIGGTAFGEEILLFLVISVYTLPVLWTASLLYRTDKKRAVAEAHIVAQYAVINKLNRELQSHVKRLEVANKELEAFSYSVSHDLRAPLRHISGFAELLTSQSGSALDSQGNRYLRTISEACSRMDKLVNDLLSFSRMGRGELQHMRIDLNIMVQEIVAELTAVNRNRPIRWVAKPLPEIEGDGPMIRIALTNYLSNAIKYTAKTAEPRIEIGGIPSEARTIIYVRDNGAGFDMKYVEKLFGVFQRLHRDDEFRGTGIGLATTRRIIERHGGETWAEGVLGRGAIFYFSLPAHDFTGAVDEPIETYSVSGG